MIDHPTSPQLEHGHTRIANTLLEALAKHPFHGGEARIVMAVLRLTYGWRKKQAPISARQLAKATGFSSRHAKRLVGALVRARIILRGKAGRRNVLGLNKRFWEWQLSTTSAHGDRAVTSQGTPPVPCGGDIRCPAIKEKKEIVVKKAVVAVQNVFEHTLRRPLTQEELATVTQLEALDPNERNGLFERLRGVV